ncbi:MAG: DUF4179 domain-containing protein [Oscillospiraceae bacterium]|nr:DUF4179 domain-containing protein [Oscillospiraceae bacterium]
MNKDIFKKAFENVKPSEELVNSVLDVQNVPAEPKKTRRFSCKRILCTAAAVCGVLVCGVTAAGAAGLIDFEAVFGNRITVNDSELAGSLVGIVSDFKYKVSDKDYKIEIKGVTGDDKKVVVIAEILRVDGTPVTDCFVNSVPPDEVQLLPLSQVIKVSLLYGFGYSMDYRVGEEGNIELSMQLYGSGLDGRKMTFKGENFYPAGAYIQYERQNETDEAVQTEYVKYRDPVAVPDSSGAVIDINDILALDLKWEFSFTYRQSDKSKQVKSLDMPEDSFTLNMKVHTFKLAEDNFYEIIAQPSYIEAGSTGGRIDYVYKDTGYVFNQTYVTDITENNEVYIIMKDGERVKAEFGNGYEKPDGNICTCSYDLTYRDEDDREIFIEGDDITAISINGVVYELK